MEAPNVWLLVKAIQELKSANDDLTARVIADDEVVKEERDAIKAANDNIANLRERFDALEQRQ